MDHLLNIIPMEKSYMYAFGKQYIGMPREIYIGTIIQELIDYLIK